MSITGQSVSDCSRIMNKVFIFLKLAFSTTLLIAFIVFFGIPSWNKYQAGEVLINKRKILTSNIGPPAITFCPADGWKNVSDYNSSESQILQHCKETKSFEEALDCIDNETYNLTETVPMSYSGNSIINSSSWINDVSYSLFGKCHTLNNSVSLGSSYWYFKLDPSLSYFVAIHDPNFFMFTPNPATIPLITLDLHPNQGIQLIYIEIIQHIDMDRIEQPCEDREDYSFTACVKNSVSRKIGCR